LLLLLLVVVVVIILLDNMAKPLSLSSSPLMVLLLLGLMASSSLACSDIERTSKSTHTRKGMVEVASIPTHCVGCNRYIGSALVDLYNGTSGATWIVSSNWLSNTDCCTWFGVICQNGNVVDMYVVCPHSLFQDASRNRSALGD
jgi:hypothetical protein